ncbi:MAG: protein-L-isoaspartate(D-aspartate) O-methyltransferase [Thermoanaerobaculales bacterium]
MTRHGWVSMLLCAMVISVAGVIMVGCDPQNGRAQTQETPDWQVLRQRMVSEQIEARGVKDPLVLESMREVPRHLFVPANSRDAAYRDSPLPIGDGQTISQPYIVALMTELLEVPAGATVLEIGTGSGYQAAVLAAMGVHVYSIEIRPRLCDQATATLQRLGFENVHVRCGDGYGGWPEQAPFDGIIVTAAPERIPDPFLEQLKVGANLVIPVGDFYQELKVITRGQGGFEERSVIPVRFVPMTGEIERQESR